MQSIFATLTLIQHKTKINLKIYFHKIKSHSDINGNNIIDKLVMNTARNVNYIPKNEFDSILCYLNSNP